MPSKAGYEPIPDAELAAAGEEQVSIQSREAAKAKYGIQGDQESELLAMLDNASDMEPSFDIPLDINPEDLLSSQEEAGMSYLWSLVAPTVSVVCTMALAWLLSMTAQGDAWISKISTDILIPLFPYFNAMVVFYNSFGPMQKRFMDAIEPVFRKLKTLQTSVDRNVDQLADKIDSVVDRLQRKVNQVLAPYLPKLNMASKLEVMVKKVKPDVDIPDPSDIDKEFDQAQGLVRSKLDDAKKQIDIPSILPSIFQSSQAFYWRVVIPFGILALAVQLLVVAVTPPSSSNHYKQQPPPFLGNLSNTLHDQSTVWESQLNSIQNATVSDMDQEDRPAMRRALVLLLLSKQPRMEEESSSPSRDDAHYGQRSNLRGLLKVGDLEDLLPSESNFTNATTSLFDDDDFLNVTRSTGILKSHWDAFQQTFAHQRDSAGDQITSMLSSIVISYLLALLELGLAYIMSGDRMKIFCINLSIKLAKRQVDKTLEASGVRSAMDEVLGTRMERIRDQLLKIFRVASELDTIPAIGGKVMGGKLPTTKLFGKR